MLTFTRLAPEGAFMIGKSIIGIIIGGAA